MTVRELITQLLNEDLDADISVPVDSGVQAIAIEGVKNNDYGDVLIVTEMNLFTYSKSTK